MDQKDKELCSKIHEGVNRQMGEHTKAIEDHEKKLDQLTRESTQYSKDIQYIGNKIENQTKAIWGLVLSIVSVLIKLLADIIREAASK